MFSSKLVPIVLLLISFSFTIGRSLNDDAKEEKFNVEGMVLCKDGRLFPDNKKIHLRQIIRMKEFLPLD
uniref:Uncharacterized protein n=1 Tax=Romanomermis culicivorax TaxID=13658 RepID=A0A915I9F1_ROMCU